jgi:hypothetical protein
MKTMLSVKPVQMRMNHGMVLIRNDYVKTFSVRFTFTLIGYLELARLFYEIDLCFNCCFV